MSPADCTAAVSEPVLVGEPHNLRPPVGGWPEAVAPKTDEQMRAEVAREAEARYRAKEFLPFAATSSDALSKAMRDVEAVREIMIDRGVEHTVAEEFGDADADVRDKAWCAARDVYDEAVSAILDVEASTPQFAMEKVKAFLAAHATEVGQHGDLSAQWKPDWLAETAFAGLWVDMQALAAAPSADALPASLIPEFERLWARELEANDPAACISDDELTARCDATGVIAHSLIRTPARTLEDIKIKAKIVAWAEGDPEHLISEAAYPLGTYGEFTRMLLADLLDMELTIPLPTCIASSAKLVVEYEAARKRFCESRDDSREDVEYAWVNSLLYAALDAPIRSSADAAAKIRLARISLGEGELSNGKDAAALQQVVDWLEAA